MLKRVCVDSGLKILSIDIYKPIENLQMGHNKSPSQKIPKITTKNYKNNNTDLSRFHRKSVYLHVENGTQIKATFPDSN